MHKINLLELAFQNINSIVNTKGLSGVYIGPSDLGIGLSDGDLGPGMDRTEVEVIDAFKEIFIDFPYSINLWTLMQEPCEFKPSPKWSMLIGNM